MLDLVISYTFRAPCAPVVQEDVQYSGPYDSEGRHTFTGGVECHACFPVVCNHCLPRWTGVGSATTARSGRR